MIGCHARGVFVCLCMMGQACPAAMFVQANPFRRYLADQPVRLKDGGHFTPVVRDGKLIAASWTVYQSGKRYGLTGCPIRIGE